MTQEEKAKRYDEKLDVARHIYADPSVKDEDKYYIEVIFPELAESEDERMRKHLIGVVELYYGNTDEQEKKDCLAWLEKQGEPKPVDKIEPKFNEGDWITNGDYTWKIVEVKPLDYILQSQDGNIVDDTIFHVDEQFHLFTIQDAKDGDVLAAKTTIGYPNPFIAIYKEHGLNFFNSHCFVSWDGEFHEGTTGHSISDIHPATKEQCDFLFQKMKEAGYEWDDEKKELKKIEKKSVECSEDNLPDFESYLCLMFQKFRTKGICTNGEIIDFVKEHSQKLKNTLCSAWSEEDERIWKDFNMAECRLSKNDLEKISKYFFGLGMAASNKAQKEE